LKRSEEHLAVLFKTTGMSPILRLGRGRAKMRQLREIEKKANETPKSSQTHDAIKSLFVAIGQTDGQ
jgi:hypothetical protein